MESQAANYDMLIIGLVLFFATHLELSVHESREFFIKRMGRNAYRGAHSLFSLGAMVLIVMGFMDRPIEDMWDAPAISAMAPVVVMPFVMMLFAGSMAKDDMARITRHPMSWAISLFAGAHLVANPDKASVMLFGSFLVYGFVAQWLSDRKARLSDPEAFAALAAKTSAIPFVALIQGRAGPKDKGLLKVILAGFVAYFVLIYLHQYFAGVALPMG